MTRVNGETRIAGTDDARTSTTVRLFLFAIPITGVLAGVVSIQGISPHAVTSTLALLAGGLALLTSPSSVSPVAKSVLWFSLIWLLVTSVHIALRGVPVDNEVTITLSGLAILIGLSSMRASKVALRVFLHGWVIAYLLAIGAALAEKYFGYLPRNNYLVFQGGRSLDDVGLSSFFGNPNGFALFLLASSIMFVPPMISANHKTARVFYTVLQVSIVYFMAQTNGRTGITVLVLVLTIAAWVALSRIPMLRFLIVLVGVGLAVISFSGIASWDLPYELGRVSLLSDSTVNDDSFVVRYNLFLSGLVFFSGSPLIGIGPSMFEQYMLNNQSPFPTMGIINPHGGAIELLSGYGIVVFALFLALLIRLWMRAYARVRSSSDLRSPRFAMGLAQLMLVAALPVASTMHSTFLGDPSAWLYICAIIVLDRMSPGAPPPTDAGDPTKDTKIA